MSAKYLKSYHRIIEYQNFQSWKESLKIMPLLTLGLVSYFRTECFEREKHTSQVTFTPLLPQNTFLYPSHDYAWPMFTDGEDHVTWFDNLLKLYVLGYKVLTILSWRKGFPIPGVLQFLSKLLSLAGGHQSTPLVMSQCLTKGFQLPGPHKLLIC